MFQTQDMLQCYKCYPDTILVNCSKKRKNKYGLFHIFFSTVNNFGRVVILAVALTNIKCRQGYDFIFKSFAERVNKEGLELPKVVITNADSEVMESATAIFTTSMHLIN